MNETDWVPGLAVLAVAAAIGVVLAIRSRRGAALPPPTETRKGELLRQKDALFQLIKEHDAVREGADATTWAAEKLRLEREAAQVLRELDRLDGATVSGPSGAPAAAAAGVPAPAATGAKGQQLVGAMWGAGTVIFLGALFWFIQQDATERAEGGSMTGNAQSASAPARGGMGGSGGQSGAIPAPELSPAEQAAIDALKAEVAAKPDDLNAKNRLAHALLEANAVMDAFQVSEEVVKTDPDNVEARTHQAMVLIGIGDLNIAAKVLDKVLTTDPAYPEALLWRGMIHYQSDEREQAVNLWEAASKADPGMASGLAPLIAKAKEPATPGQGGGAMPSNHPPVTALDPGASGGPFAGTQGGGLATAAGTAASGQDISGELRDPNGAVKPGDTLFVLARPEGQEGGAPTWVQRLTVSSLPMSFTLGPANAMMAGPTPAKLVITARVDRDKNMKSSSGDVEGRTAALTPGTKGVTIDLAPVP